jgi:hypothetical protein
MRQIRDLFKPDRDDFWSHGGLTLWTPILTILVCACFIAAIATAH